MSTPQHSTSKVIAFSGGIGGAKLALGLKRILPPHALTVIANTADDFEHMGLAISPDIDTLVYTLAGINNIEQGWGRAGETWTFMQALGELGGQTWFNLGDGDLAMHVLRSHRLASGDSLSAITADICSTLNTGATIRPMSDQPVRTRLRTDDGWLDFQDYFVARQAKPVIHEIAYAGIENAKPTPGLLDIVRAPDIAAIVICPSNPLISIEPILAVDGIAEALIEAPAPVIAISPIIDGKAVKGPTAKMLQELGHEATAASILQRYSGLIDAFIADPRDIATLSIGPPDIDISGADIMMVSLEDRDRLARTVMEVAASLAIA